MDGWVPWGIIERPASVSKDLGGALGGGSIPYQWPQGPFPPPFSPPHRPASHLSQMTWWVPWRWDKERGGGWAEGGKGVRETVSTMASYRASLPP